MWHAGVWFHVVVSCFSEQRLSPSVQQLQHHWVSQQWRVGKVTAAIPHWTLCVSCGGTYFTLLALFTHQRHSSAALRRMSARRGGMWKHEQHWETLSKFINLSFVAFEREILSNFKKKCGHGQNCFNTYVGRNKVNNCRSDNYSGSKVLGTPGNMLSYCT